MQLTFDVIEDSFASYISFFLKSIIERTEDNFASCISFIFY